MTFPPTLSEGSHVPCAHQHLSAPVFWWQTAIIFSLHTQQLGRMWGGETGQFALKPGLTAGPFPGTAPPGHAVGAGLRAWRP